MFRAADESSIHRVAEIGVHRPVVGDQIARLKYRGRIRSEGRVPGILQRVFDPVLVVASTQIPIQTVGCGAPDAGGQTVIPRTTEKPGRNAPGKPIAGIVDRAVGQAHGQQLPNARPAIEKTAIGIEVAPVRESVGLPVAAHGHRGIDEHLAVDAGRLAPDLLRVAQMLAETGRGIVGDAVRARHKTQQDAVRIANLGEYIGPETIPAPVSIRIRLHQRGLVGGQPGTARQGEIVARAAAGSAASGILAADAEKPLGTDIEPDVPATR